MDETLLYGIVSCGSIIGFVFIVIVVVIQGRNQRDQEP